MPLLSLIPRRAAARVESGEAESDLVRHIAAGDRAALESLYRGYQPRLVRFLGRTTRRLDVIEEAINDTFWIVWQKAGNFRGDSRVSTWIMGIAWRCALKSLRDRGDAGAEAPAEDTLEAGWTDPTADHELHDWVAKGLARLPVEQRVTLELAYGAGHSLEEIASIMDCQVTTVKARMFHARVKLRNVLPVLAGEGGPARDGRAHAETKDDEPS
ncbi:MAG: RNA polymerase sigma factor [Rhizobacter sp.]